MVEKRLILVVACITAILLSSAASCFVVNPVRISRSEEVLTLPDNEPVILTGMFVDAVMGRFCFVHDPLANSPIIPVYTLATVKPFWSIRITGHTATIGRRIVVADEISLYTTDSAGLQPAPPMMCWWEPDAWPYMVPLPNLDTIPGNSDIPVPPDTSTLISEPSTPSSAPVGSVASAKIGNPASGTVTVQSISLASTPPQFTTGSITLTAKCVSAAFPDFFYIEEADRSCGIKVVSFAQVEAGELVNIDGTVVPSSSSVAECHVLASSVAHSGWADVPRTISMPQRMLAGGVFGQQQATYRDTTTTPTVPGVGLNPIGLRVTTYGRLTAPFQEGGNTAWYIEDGSNLKLTTSGGAQTGMKLISWEGCTAPTDQGGSTYSATGILGAEMDASSLPVPVVRVPCPGLSVNITTPPAGELHIASGQTSVVISGTASALGTGVASVQMKIDSGTWQPVTYNRDTHTWTYTWQSPSSTTIYAKVTDYSGNTLETSRIVTVSGVGVIYVKPGGGGNGTTWATACGSVDTAIINADTYNPKREVWVAAGTYSGNNGRCTLRSNIAVYGGFLGNNETAREERNWKANQAILDGGAVGKVVTMNGVTGCRIDGFTIRNGYATDGAGFWCYNTSGTITNNIIRDNKANGNGGGLWAWNSPLLTVVGNVLADNRAGSKGGGIYYVSNSGDIASNTIIWNTGLADGGGIYLYYSSPALSNNIVASNIGGGIYKDSNSSPTFQNNDVFGNSKYPYSWTPVPSADFQFDPGIPNIDWGDWHIAETSQCRGRGVLISALSDKDIDGENRIYASGSDTGIDIGADEWNGTDPATIFPIVQHPSRWDTWQLVSGSHQPVIVHGDLSCPLVADLVPGDNGANEVALCANKRLSGTTWLNEGSVFIFRSSGELAWESANNIDSNGRNTLSAADIDQGATSGNQHLELIAPNGLPTAHLDAFAYDAGSTTFKPLAGWPVIADFYFQGVTAAIGDINLDGTLEVVAGDESCYVFSWNPTGGVYLWKQITGSRDTYINYSSVALGDVDADAYRIPDVIVGSWWSNPLFGFAGDSWGQDQAYPSPSSAWPKPVNSPGTFMDCSPAIGLLDSDTLNDFTVGASDGRLYMWLSSTSSWFSWQLASSTDPNKEIRSAPVIAEMDGDRCAVVGCNDGRVYVMKSGSSKAGWYPGIYVSRRPGFKIIASPIVADVMNTGSPQIVVACTDGNVYALWSDGNNHQGGPIAAVWRCVQSLEGQINSTPTVCSLDGSTVSMIVCSSDGIYKVDLYTLEQGQQFVPNSARWPWPTFRRDNARTGCQTTNDNPAPPISASITGKVTLNSSPVQGALVSIYTDSQLTQVPAVYQRSTSRTNPVLSAGTGPANDEINEGAYCINQLPSSQTYWIRATDANGQHATTVSVVVTTGRSSLDIQLTP